LRGQLFPLASPGPVLGPSRFPQPRPCGVLWSARYPCQHRLSASFGSDSTPKPFGLALFPSLADSTNRAPSTPVLELRLTYSTASCSISRTDLSLLSSVPVSGPSHFPQSRPCGVLWSAHYPCQLHLSVSLGPDSAPDSLAPRCGFSSASSLLAWTDCSGGSSAYAAGPFHSHFLDPSGAHLAFLRRDLRRPLVCTLPLPASPIGSFGSGSTPDSLARRCGNSLALLAFDRRRIFQAAPPLARLALSTHVSWTRYRSVSLSSAETLRRAPVCTLPLPESPHGFLWV